MSANLEIHGKVNLAILKIFANWPSISIQPQSRNRVFSARNTSVPCVQSGNFSWVPGAWIDFKHETVSLRNANSPPK